MNALYGTIPLKEQHKKALKKYSNKIKYIGDKANSVKNRKHVVTSGEPSLRNIHTFKLKGGAAMIMFYRLSIHCKTYL